jgi:hypothetical protein
VLSALSDTGSGMIEFLSALGQREAIAFGDGVTLPVRIKFDALPRNALPRSSTARFSEKWQNSVGDEGFLDLLVEKWRAAGVGTGTDTGVQAAMIADSIELQLASEVEPARAGGPRRDGSGYGAGRAGASSLRRDPAVLMPPVPLAPAPAGNGVRTLRERLLQRPPSAR